MYKVELARGQRSQVQPFACSCAMLMSPNEDETAFMAAAARVIWLCACKVPAISRSFVGLLFCFVCNSFLHTKKSLPYKLESFKQKNPDLG